MSINVAVTGLHASDNPAPGIGVIRSLRHPDEWDGKIIGLAYDTYDTGVYDAGLLNHTYLIPYPNADSRQMLERLKYIHEQAHLNVIIPTLDSEVAIFQKLEQVLKGIGIRMFIPGREAVDKRAKRNLVEFCRLNDILTPNTISINDPNKFDEALRRAFSEGAIVNVDNYDEIYLIEDLADEIGRPLEIGIRVNMNLNDPPWYKFGFNIESGHAFEAIKRAVSGGKLRLNGLHTHIGTYVDDVNFYRKAAQEIVNLYARIQQVFNTNLKYLDLGGGFASQNALHWAYLSGEQTCPTYDQYAENICSILMQSSISPADLPRLFIEPGRALIDEPISLITTIVAQKRLPDGKRAVVLDAGMNILSSVQWYRYNIRTAQNAGTTMEETIVYGGLCMNIDVINQSVSLPPIRRGEFLVIPYIGAYNLSQSMQFIYPRPQVIAIDEGEIHLIREAETVTHLQKLDCLPEKYKLNERNKDGFIL